MGGPIQLKGSNKCLDVVNTGGDFNGAPVELMDCDHIKLSEAWKFEKVETQSHSQFPGALQFVAAMAAFGLFGFTAWLWLSRQKAKRAALSGGIPLRSNEAGVPLSVPAVMAIKKGTPGENGVPEVRGGCFFTGGGFSTWDPDASTENKIKGDLKANSPLFRNDDDDDDAPFADEEGVPQGQGSFFTSGGFMTSWDPDQ